MTFTKLRDLVSDIKRKLRHIDDDISDGNRNIENMEHDFIELKTKYLGNKQPAQVSQLRARIKRRRTKLSEGILIKANLEKKLKDAEHKLQKAEKIETAKGIKKQVEEFLQLCKRVDEIKNEYIKAIDGIYHFQRKIDPLNRLYSLCGSLGDISRKDIGIDLNQIISAFSNIFVNDFPELQSIENTEIGIRNALAKLRAMESGSRHFHIIKPKKYTIPPLSEKEANLIDSHKYNQEQGKSWKMA